MKECKAIGKLIFKKGAETSGRGKGGGINVNGYMW